MAITVTSDYPNVSVSSDCDCSQGGAGDQTDIFKSGFRGTWHG